MLGFLFVAAASSSPASMVGFRVMPAYIEYYSVQKALEQALADAKDLNSAPEIRNAFEKRAMPATSQSVQSRDVEVTKIEERGDGQRELDAQAAAGRRTSACSSNSKPSATT